MGLATITKNPQVAQVTTNIFKSKSGGGKLSLTDMHGNGSKLKVKDKRYSVHSSHDGILKEKMNQNLYELNVKLKFFLKRDEIEMLIK